MDSDFSKTQEFYDLMSTFENTHKYLRLDREKRGDTPAGNWYQSGETNDVFKQYLNGYMTGRAIYLGHADEAEADLTRLRADAALGRAVRSMTAWMFLYQNSIGWFSGTEMTHGTRNYGPKCDTPEAALQAAGMMEVER